VIQIPPRVVLQSLQDWCILHFKDISHDPTAPSHWYFTIPINPGALFVLCIITSQVEKRVYYYQKINPKAAQSLVRLEARSFSFLPKESLIDCNKTELLTIEEIERRIKKDVGLDIENPEIPSALKQKIKAAIINSPLVPKSIKKHLDL